MTKSDPRSWFDKLTMSACPELFDSSLTLSLSKGEGAIRNVGAELAPPGTGPTKVGPCGLLLFVAAVLLICTARVRTDDPVSSSVRFTGEIVRIFDRKCLPCHGSDSLAMPLTTYRDVRAWGRAIREEIVEQRMPPWTAARGYGRFQNELALTSREEITILSWLDGGMARGDDRDLPARTPSPQAGAADVHVPLPPQRVPAREDHVVRRVSIDTNLEGNRAIARVAVNPGTERVLRGALVLR